MTNMLRIEITNPDDEVGLFAHPDKTIWESDDNDEAELTATWAQASLGKGYTCRVIEAGEGEQP